MSISRSSSHSSLGLLNSSLLSAAAEDDLLLSSRAPVSDSKPQVQSTEAKEDDDDNDVSQVSIRFDKREIDDLDADFSGFESEIGETSFLNAVESNGVRSGAQSTSTPSDQSGGTDQRYVTACSGGLRQTLSHNNTLSDQTIQPNSVVNPFDADPCDFGSITQQQMQLQADFGDDDFMHIDEQDQMEYIDAAERENQELNRFEQPEVDASVAETPTADTSVWSVQGDRTHPAIPRPEWYPAAEAECSKLSPSTLFAAGSGALGNLSDQKAPKPCWGTDVNSPRRNDLETTVMSQNAQDVSVLSGAKMPKAPSPLENSSGRPFVSTPMESRKRRSPDYTILPAGLSAFSAVAPPSDATHFATDRAAQQMSVAQVLSESGSPSVSAIHRCVANLSVGANASALADMILKARNSLKQPPPSASPDSALPESARSGSAPELDAFAEQSAAETQNVQLERPRSARGGNVADQEPVVEHSMLRDRSLCPDQSTVLRQNNSRLPDAPNPQPTHIEKKKSVVKLESNKQHLVFGCVAVGRRVIQMARIRNSSREILQLQIYIKRQSSCFELIDPSDQNGVSGVILHPGESHSVKVVFCPLMSETYSNKVVLQIVGSSRFSIALSGTGDGDSNGNAASSSAEARKCSIVANPAGPSTSSCDADDLRAENVRLRDQVTESQQLLHQTQKQLAELVGQNSDKRTDAVARELAKLRNVFQQKHRDENKHIRRSDAF